MLLINIWYASTFTQHLDSPPSNSINFFVSLFISLQCCYDIDIASVRGELMARAMNFRKFRLEEYTAPSSLCLRQYPPEVSHRSRNRISVSSGNYVFLVTKYDGNYNW